MFDWSKYIEAFGKSFIGYANYLFGEITHVHWGNYFYWLTAISLFFFCLEIIIPWRKEQGVLRNRFWMDAFYMYFNFFLFSLVGFAAISEVVVLLFNDALGAIGVTNLVAIYVGDMAVWLQLLLLLVIRDFLHYFIHRLLHRSPLLWKFHMVHHSIRDMGFAAHLRFHWMESVVYRVIEYVPLAVIGFGIDDFLVVHLFALAIGHANHSNIYVPLGPLKYLLNSPQMHIWHHAKELPNQTGANFGLTFSVWDYLFGTAYVPNSGRDIELGFDQVEKYPQSFWQQLLAPFKKD